MEAFFTIDVKKRGRYRKVNAIYRAIVYTDGTLGILALLRVDFELNATYGYQ
jgi:hypothetical protein